MKALLSISFLAAASPLSAIVLNVPFNSFTSDILTGSTSVLTSPSGPLAFGAGSSGKRVNPNGNLVPTSVSSEAPTFYNTFTFGVVTSGNYSFSTQFGLNSMDGFLALYLNSYDPNAPLTNVLRANNDASPINQQSLVNVPLVAGQNYVLLNTFANGSTVGSNAAILELLYPSGRTVFTSISGPGPLTVDEIPFGVDSTLGLAVLGAVGALRLRRRRAA